MKRLGRIWPQVTSFDNLFSAYLKARKGKQSSPAVAAFSLDLEAELLGVCPRMGAVARECHFESEFLRI